MRIQQWYNAEVEVNHVAKLSMMLAAGLNLLKALKEVGPGKDYYSRITSSNLIHRISKKQRMPSKEGSNIC